MAKKDKKKKLKLYFITQRSTEPGRLEYPGEAFVVSSSKKEAERFIKAYPSFTEFPSSIAVTRVRLKNKGFLTPLKKAAK